MKINKKRLARRMSGLESNHFQSPQWLARKEAIKKRVEDKLKQ